MVIMSVEHVGKVALSLHWRIRRQIMYLWEIDVDALMPYVPARLDPIEVRPGIGLFAIEALHYHTDHFRDGYPEFLEAVLTAAVQPDLSIEQPVPRFCMHAISVISESPEFVEQEGRILFTPTELVPGLRMEFSEDGASCDLYDGDEPIALCRNTGGPPAYEPKVLWGQYYTNTRGLQQGIWRWDGEMFEHQKKGDWGRLSKHAFFKGMDLSRVRGCYRQMMARPDFQNSARFYHVGSK
jgi:hypothetical protein